MARQMIEHDPAYRRRHITRSGWSPSTTAMRQPRRSEFALALKVWAKADPDLPEVRELRGKLGK